MTNVYMIDIVALEKRVKELERKMDVVTEYIERVADNAKRILDSRESTSTSTT